MNASISEPLSDAQSNSKEQANSKEQHSSKGSVLITGAAKRIGAAIAKTLHQQGYRVLLHFRDSEKAIQTLSDTLNAERPDSALIFKADLTDSEAVCALADWVVSSAPDLRCLINNASIFEPDPRARNHADTKGTPEHEASRHAWDQHFQVNSYAPYLLSQQLKEPLQDNQGSIINLVDIYSERPLAKHSIYSASKAANAMLVKTLALELAPSIRVNGISPGAILWPETESSECDSYQSELLKKVPLARLGSVEAITQGVCFLLECDYLTGQIINIDGGRSITI